MSERQRQTQFLKTLLGRDPDPGHEDLGHRLQAAERDERCMKRACRLVAIITMLALAVLGYLLVLKVPDQSARLAQAALRFCEALALGSAMCLGVFVGLLFWHRALINRLLAEGRKLITSEIQARPRQTHTDSSTVIVREGDTAVYHIRTDAPLAPGTEAVSSAKAT